MLKTTENGEDKPRVWGKTPGVLAGAERFGAWRRGSPP